MKNNSLSQNYPLDLLPKQKIFEKMQKKTLKNDLDWLLANDVSENQKVFNGDYNSIVFLKDQVRDMAEDAKS